MRRRKIKAGFQSKSNLPVIKLLLGERMACYALLDTGSEVSMFDAEFAEKHKLLFVTEKRNATMEIKGFKSSHNVQLVDTNVMFRVYDMDEKTSDMLIANGMLFDLGHISGQLRAEYNEDIDLIAILGNDFLSRYNAVIDYKNRTVVI